MGFMAGDVLSRFLLTTVRSKSVEIYAWCYNVHIFRNRFWLITTRRGATNKLCDIRKRPLVLLIVKKFV